MNFKLTIGMLLAITSCAAHADFCSSSSGKWEGQWTENYAGVIQHDRATITAIYSNGNYILVITTSSGVSNMNLSGICGNNTFSVQGSVPTSLGPYAVQMSGTLTGSTMEMKGIIGTEETIQANLDKTS